MRCDTSDVGRAAAGNHEDAGLQPQRSALAWSRTSLALLGNSVLILLRDVQEVRVLIPGLLAVLIAAATTAIGWRRGRVLMRRPLPSRLAARTPVHLIGWSVAVLGALTLGLLILPDAVDL